MPNVKGSARLGGYVACSECGELLPERNITGMCKRCWRRISARSIKPINTGKKGCCRLCGKGFDLLDWQYSSLHWCLECRKSQEYTEYQTGSRFIMT